MGKLEEIVIALDQNPECIVPDVYGGLTLTGRVLLTLNESIQVNYLKVQLLASAICRWSEGSGTSHRIVSSHDPIIDMEQLLIETGVQATTLSAGQQAFPFSFNVQSQRHLPSSLIGMRNGRITYDLHAKLDRSGVIFDDKTTLPLTVRNPVTIAGPELVTPATTDHEHVDCCLCCASGPVLVEMTLNKSAIRLHTQDTVDVTLKIDNMKNKTLTPKVRLQSRAHFKAGCKGRNTVLASIKPSTPLGPIQPRTRGNIVRFTLGPISGDQIGTINSTLNLHLIYEVALEFKGSRFKMQQPITVGVERNAPKAPDAVSPSVINPAMQVNNPGGFGKSCNYF